MFQSDNAPSSVEEARGRHVGTRHRAGLLTATLLFAACAFAADIALPHGAADGLPYVLLPLVACGFHNRSYLLLCGIVATVLTVAGLAMTPAGGVLWMGLANRSVAMVAVWAYIAFMACPGHPHGKIERGGHRPGDEAAGLREARKALDRAERLAALGIHAGTVAHELRNPLGVVLTSISVIETVARDAGLDLEAALARARRGIQRCEDIITEHLDAARAHGHRPVPLVLDSWLAALIGEISTQMAVPLQATLATGDTVAAIDPESFRRAIINLVDNARQAAPGHATAITVGSSLREDYVEVYVADNGPGISPALAARVIEPLFSTKAAGTGLGLPTVQRIMDAHDGILEILENEGGGTRVSLLLPQPSGN